MRFRIGGYALALLVVLGIVAGWAESAAAQERSTSRRLKQIVRKVVVDDEDLEKFGIELDADWQARDAASDVVVLLHGLNSTPGCNGAILEPIRAAGLPCGSFCYPNDHGLADSAKLLARDLKTFAADHPGRGVSLVCHSMGGLVARACIENAELDPGNVRRLIMIATPNQGSLAAKAAHGLDLCEHGLKFGRGGFKASIVDGLAEAPDDLLPGSEFLIALNARQRNPHTRYTILLGTGALVKPWELALTRETLRLSTKKIPYVKEKAKEFDEVLADLDEVVAGRGDGVVAVKRGRLEGVDDVVVMKFGHLAVTGPAQADEIREVHDLVLDRLRK